MDNNQILEKHDITKPVPQSANNPVYDASFNKLMILLIM